MWDYSTGEKDPKIVSRITRKANRREPVRGVRRSFACVQTILLASPIEAFVSVLSAGWLAETINASSALRNEPKRRLDEVVAVA